ncbi:nidogen-like domain-containing protein [Ditylenchus destructor]|nr:nidogen-like domain-containing protein [Ditylenchus destructor]
MFFRYGTDVGDQQLPQYDGAMESQNALAGFVLHEPFSEELEYLISGSKSPEMLTIASRSNVGSPGKWIFQIDQPTIYEPNSVCGFPPIENYGWCKAEEFVPDTLAHCRCLFTKENTTLKCSRSADNKTVAWTGNLPECHLPFSTTAQSPPSV